MAISKTVEQFKLISDALNFTSAQNDVIEFIGRTYLYLITNQSTSIKKAIDHCVTSNNVVDEQILSDIQRGYDIASEYGLITEFISELFDLAQSTPEDTISELVSIALLEWDLPISLVVDSLDYGENIEQDYSEELDQCSGCPDRNDCNRIPSMHCDPCIDNDEY